MDRAEYILIVSVLFLFSLCGYAIYKTAIKVDIMEIEFKVFDSVRYSETNIKIHTYGEGSFTIWGELDVEIIDDASYYLKYFKNTSGYYIPIEIRRVII